MFEKFSVQVRHALIFAREEAIRFGHPSIEPEHLLLGIIRTGESIAAKLLISLNVDLNLVRTTTETYLNMAVFPPRKVLGSSADTRRVIEHAVHAAHQSDYVGTEHFLLGLLQMGESVAAQVLRSYDVTPERIRQQIVRLFAEEPNFYRQEMQAEPPPPTLDPLKQEQAKSHSRDLHSVGLLVSILFIFALIFAAGYFDQIAGFITGLNNLLIALPLFNLQPVAGWHPVSTFVYFMLIVGGWQIIALPLNWFIKFFLPRHHRIRSGTLRHWFTSYLKYRGWKLLSRCLFFELFTLLLVIQPQSWWLWTSLAYLLYGVLSIYFSPILSYRMFYTLTPLPEGPLLQTLMTLAEATHTPVRRFLKMENKEKEGPKNSHLTANAYLMGWGKTRSIVFTNSVLDYFSTDEIVSIAAHEIGHHVHHDLWKTLVSRSLLLLVFLFACNLFFHGLTATLNMPMIPGLTRAVGILLGSFAYLLLVIALNLYFAYKRHMEYRADEYALRATRNPTAFKNAMIRLANYNAIPIDSLWSRANPGTHPFIASRLKHADRFAAKLAKRRSTQRQSA